MSSLNLPTFVGIEPPRADDLLSLDELRVRGAEMPLGLDPAAGETFVAQVIGDLDGDGTREMAIAMLGDDGEQHDYVAQMAADRQVRSAVDLTGLLCSRWDCYADFVGDGRSQIMILPHSAADPSFVRLGVWNLGRGVLAPPGSDPVDVFQTNIPFTNYAAADQLNLGWAAPHAVDLNGDGKLDVLMARQDATCGSDTLGNKLGVFAYINTTVVDPVTRTLSATYPPKFLIPTGHLICLSRTFSGSDLQESESIDHISDFDGNGLPEIFVSDSVAEAPDPSLTRIVSLQRSGSGIVRGPERSCTDIGLTDSGEMGDECRWSNGYAIRWIDVNADGLEDFVIARPNEGVWQLRLNTGGQLGGVITTTGPGSTAGLDKYINGEDPNRHIFKYANRLPVMDVESDGKPDLLVVSRDRKFAVKMCSSMWLPPRTDGENCEGVGISVGAW